ncbi:hypothetical protein H9X85_02960 [Anaerotignum lactatifermentans]|uniref:Zinc-ribbon domain-containing protein n=1 Tax=Anaerotignum lactatifermentans TaxID=160404 RepID=A0ABS2GAS3_9FIRM|nr:hypothetical protein [Anaerotignum lactatifermentans]MBM6828592.1 hypothetical protein [Anaerotignum lactatifermentans]MBM6878536.1 hypothetical protein [Anaerotignum lactatifermentans]MBM6950174.1 hypothetical protein [Anaerotignum lactatifermentans]
MAKTCRYCGGQMADEDRFCVTCGRPYGEERRQEETGARNSSGGTWGEEHRAQEEASREPLSVGSYFLMFLIMAIPVVNLIFLIYWAVGKQVNVNRKNFSRAALIYVVAGTLVAIVFAVMIFLGLAKVGYSYDPYYQYYEYYDAPYVDFDDDFYEYYLPEGEDDSVFSFADASLTVGDGNF